MPNYDIPEHVCPHLLAAPGLFSVWFIGHGTRANWACPSCSTRYPRDPLWVEADAPWIKANLSKFRGHGILGHPTLVDRTAGLRFNHVDWPVALPAGLQMVDAQPSLKQRDEWYALLNTGEIALLNIASRQIQVQAKIPDLKFEINETTGLSVSACCTYAAVYQSGGSSGTLLRLTDGSVVCPLFRGDYHEDQTAFPIAFWTRSGKTYLIAGSAWNRLDMIDCESGAVITRRDATHGGMQKSPHYLDYFHGCLTVQQESHRIADDGWDWGPVAVISTWCLDAWLDNPWESEDGPSVRRANYREDWSAPLCWVDHATLAVWVHGSDNVSFTHAIVRVDVRDGEIIGWFPIPVTDIDRFSERPSTAQSLFFDRYLFTANERLGTMAWDINTGERLLTDSSMRPTRYHPLSKQFLEIKGTVLRFSELIES